jgi:hypothetical protein
LGGFGTGVVKGLGGLVIKNVSAIITPPAYVGKGVLVWSGKKMEGEGTKKFLRRSHFTEGFVELLDLRNAASADAEKKEKLQKTLTKVGERWKETGVVRDGKEKKGKESSTSPAQQKGRPRSSSRPKSGKSEKETQPLRSSKEEQEPIRSAPPQRSETAPILGSTSGTPAKGGVTLPKHTGTSPDGDPDSHTADGSGIGSKGHLDPLIPASPTDAIRDDDDDDDDLPSDTTLADPVEAEEEESHHGHDDDDDDDEKSTKDATEDKPPPPPLHDTVPPASTDLRHEDFPVSATEMEKMEKNEREDLVSADGEKKKNGGKEAKKNNSRRSKLPSPRAMMKGTKFGRRSVGEKREVGVV